ncbi:MAG: hypothetical protein M1820_006501 [Bogoriella megaspora]|nr:MAG: hypothetical protein M1820_006501 [Bogoriella megaspora]
MGIGKTKKAKARKVRQKERSRFGKENALKMWKEDSLRLLGPGKGLLRNYKCLPQVKWSPTESQRKERDDELMKRHAEFSQLEQQAADNRSLHEAIGNLQGLKVDAGNVDPETSHKQHLEDISPKDL